MRTRTDTKTRHVPVTIDGHTVIVEEPYTVEIPIPPKDWDQTVRTGLLALAALIGAAAITWSTVSIGALLKTDVPTVAAYAAAGTFDLLWIGCMALEWLARYNPTRAAAPRRAGWAALAVAMFAITTHGHTTATLTIGLIGATVSLGAKTLWALTLKSFSSPLDDRTQQWVNIQRAEAEGQLALVAVRRELNRARTLTDAEETTLRTPPETTPEPAEETPEPTPSIPSTGPMTMTEAIRKAISSGITDPPAVLRYVRKVVDANAKEESVLRILRELRRTAS